MSAPASAGPRAPVGDAPVVAARGLGVRFGRAAALDGVSFEVRPGELFGVIGPDGAGKTTLFRVLVSLLVPDTGESRVLGLDPVGDLWALRARVGYMPGRFSLYPDLTVEENLRFFAAVFGTTPERGGALIAPVYGQIAAFRDRRAGALSGGMKQKLALSCALVHRPEVLFLDEPTTGVDAVSRREFWDLLGELRGAGLTTMVSTPYMDEAARCDRVALMQGGRLLEVDTPAAVAAGYPLPLIAVRVADPRARVRLLATLRAYPHAHRVVPFGATVHYTDARPGGDAAAIADALAAHLRAAGFAGATAAPTPASVEDRFMALMGPEGA